MKRLIPIASLMFLMLLTFLALPAAWSAGREFLTPQEIGSIQDEQDPGKRVLLYMQFAQRRLDTVKDNTAAKDPKAGEAIQNYLQEYISILDAVGDMLDSARQQRSLLSKAIKEMESRGRAFLTYLESLKSGAASSRSDYEYTLEEAIDNTKDLLANARKGAFPEVKDRKAPTEFPSAPPPPSKSGAGGQSSGRTDQKNPGKSGTDKGGDEGGPPRKRRSASQNQ